MNKIGNCIDSENNEKNANNYFELKKPAGFILKYCAP
jgi:hypothetical protein